jgi:replicative DNA helicase
VSDEDRVLPHNFEAERSVLGAILVNNTAMDAVVDKLKPEDFYRDAHRRIFTRMLMLYQRSEAIDFVTLKEQLRRSKDLAEVGGPAYISGLADGMPHGTNIVYYARIIKEKATLRNVITAANRMLTRAYEAEVDAAEVLDETERALLEVSGEAVPGEMVSADQMVRNIYPVIEALTATKRPVTGLSTGFHELDRYTRGLQPGNLIIIAGRPGQGKSTFVSQVALHAAQTVTVGFWSIEMTEQEHTFRALATLGQLDGHLLQCGQLGMHHMANLSHAMSEYAERKLWLDSAANVSALQVRSKARRLKAKHGLGLIVVDYLQLMQHPKADSRDERVAATSRMLLAVAKELSVPVIAVCQMSRAVESRAGGRPQLSDLRESGALEQDANVVLFVHRPPKTDNGAVSEVPPTELIIAKQRMGPTTSIDLRWHLEQYRFVEIEGGR